jgi:hypothetical protein
METLWLIYISWMMMLGTPIPAITARRLAS